MNIIFPHLNKFADFFDAYQLWKYQVGQSPLPVRIVKKKYLDNPIVISSYCTIRGEYYSLEVLPNQKTLCKLINMIVVGDQMYWQITIQNDKEALLSLVYNSIIGSFNLAIIERRTIPCF